jgi:hypothetical protein
MSEITFNITKKIALLSTGSKGWTKELNLVEWNGKPAKFDVREWSPDHERMGKGVTLNEEEAKTLSDALKALFP